MAGRGLEESVQLTEPESWSGSAPTVVSAGIPAAPARSATPSGALGSAGRSSRPGTGADPRSGEQAAGAPGRAAPPKPGPGAPAGAGGGAKGGGGQPPAGATSAASPLLPKAPAGPLSVTAATTVACKALLGVTLFAQPWAFANAGTVMVPVAVVFVTLLTLYTAQMLVTVRQSAVAVLPPPAAGAKQLQLASLPALAGCVLGSGGALAAELCVLLACFGILAGYLTFASAALQPLVPTRHVWLLVWGVSPGAALLCLARGMEHAAVLSLLGNTAAAASSIGLVACFAHLIATGAARGDPAPGVASLEAWDQVDSLGQHGLLGVPIPMAALAASASGFMVHFTLPALEAAMTTPRRAMEAVTRAFLLSAVVLLAFGALGAAGAGATAPRNALDMAGKGAMADLLRVFAAIDALTTAPVLVRPALLVLESQWERSTGIKLQSAGAGALRCAFVIAAAAAAAAAPQGRFATAMPLLCGGAALACTLLLPPIMLLVGADAAGEPLVQSGGAERTAAGCITALGIGALLFTGMAFAGAFKAVPFPYNAPPAPPSEAEYDYNNDYVVAERYAFTRGNVNSTETDAAVSAASNSPAAVAAAIVQQQEQQEEQAQQPHNASAYWLNQWLHIANATAAAKEANATAANATAAGNATAGPLDGWHPGETFSSAAWNPSMYHPPEVPGLEAPGPVAANTGSGAGGASSDE